MLGDWELCEGYADRICKHRQGYTLYEGLVPFVSVGMLHIRHVAHTRRLLLAQSVPSSTRLQGQGLELFSSI